MSTSDILPPNDDLSTNTTKKVSMPSDEAPLVTTKIINGHSDEKVEDEKPKTFYRYTKDELLELRTAPSSLVKPLVLLEEFLNKDGIWDPELWFKSKASRSASPAVIDGKPILDEKKSDFYDGDDIELAPRRESFKQGCQVKVSQGNSVHRPSPVDRKSRLTGRAASQRRPVETNYKDGDSISEKAHEFEKMRKDKALHFMDREDRFQDRTYRYNDRFSKSKGYSNDRDHSYKSKNSYENHRESGDDGMPEWMIDGPTSQLDTIELTTHKDIEEEKKAFAKKNKKVRISPDVETQEIMKISSKPSRKTPSPKQKELNKQKKPEKTSGRPGFEIDEFLQSVDYYPPELFPEDLAHGDGVKSRFTQYFQNTQGKSNSCSSSVSISSSEPLVPDEVFSGPKPQQPPYFTPIQPAPALLSAAATAHAVQSSNIASIIQKQKDHQLAENLKKAGKEVRGRLNVEELEGESPGKSLESNIEKSETKDKSAFNMFLKTMKDAGQLPEKPSPVVSGLPVHLLPQPPTRTSPVFEKLKRSLSRSPSPKEFVKAVSTVAGILSTNPSIDRELALLHRKDSTGEEVIVASNDVVLDQSVNMPIVGSAPKTPSSGSPQKDTVTPASHLKKTPKNAFTPTSVLKKMHNDRKEDCVSPSLPKEKSDPDVSLVNISANGKYPDVLPDQVRGEKVGTFNVEQNLDQQFNNAVATPERSQLDIYSTTRMLPFHSAPSTPRQKIGNVNEHDTSVSVSAPGTPDHRNILDTPTINRYPIPDHRSSDTLTASHDSAFESIKAGKTETVLMTPSAFQSTEKSSQKSVGVIGSGVPHKSSEQLDIMEKLDLNDRSSPRQVGANPKLAPGNGASLRSSRPLDSPSGPNPLLLNPLQQLVNQQQVASALAQHPPSQQQQLLQAQRRAQIQQAQLLQQQKLREIAKQANQQNPVHDSGTITNASRPLLPNPEKSSQPQPEQQRSRPLYQQSQHRQVLAYQQQQKQQQQQMLAQHQRQFRQQSAMPFSHGQMRAPQPTQPHLPIPLQQPGVGIPPFQQPPLNPGFANVNFTAQALVQQQLITQARARFLQAHLLQQQPQVVQAALMAQAALVRGQAQAQAAMMLNPRNRQAMAEQLGLRQPFSQNKVSPSSGTPHQTVDSSKEKVSPSSDSPSTNVLSKWFSNDVLQQMPASKGPKPAELGNAHIMSVEELERKQTNH